MQHSNIFKKEVLGKSLSGVEIPILTITDFSETNKRKKTILMVGRLHPGETHSSWLIHGFIRFILSESPKARELRKKVVFKIVPMLNPDGVIVGNYRCTLAGCDMNRNFGGFPSAAQRLNPETLLFKNMAKQQSRLAFFFDVHSHSSKKSIFIYGPYFPLHSEHYLKIRVLPRLLAAKS
jgi:murein tripeptide amidase MpaA